MSWFLLLWLVLPVFTFTALAMLLPGGEVSPRWRAARDRRRARITSALDRVATRLRRGASRKPPTDPFDAL